MATDLTFLISGFVFGLSGLIPGPLLTLVISESLKYGVKEGIKIAIAPLFSDLLIVLVTIFVLAHLSDIQPALGVISMLGGTFLVYLAIESLSFRGTDINTDNANPESVKKGIITNFLNPSPYMFWFSIGAPTVVKAMDIGLVSVLIFVVSFYITLIGSKVVVALITGRSRYFLKSRNFIYTIRLLGVALLIFAALFIRNSLNYFGLL
ncbi:LysE family translocator [Deltaproteobacteria bacterium]|nr:LysE family translocator [Deltaproteobacteria bacterium]